MAEVPASALGSFKFEGRLVSDGIIDARSAARALNGIDQIVQYFAELENPNLASIEIPIPVVTRQGSWEALIPQTIEAWIKTAAGIAGTAYLTKAAQKLAENDFKDVSLKDILRKVLRHIQTLIEVGKHLGHLQLKTVERISWDRADHVGIPNEKSEMLYVPTIIWRKLLECPVHLLAKIVAVVEEERSLVVTLRVGSLTTSAEITKKEKHIFVTDEEVEDEILFPELEHGKMVTLDGVVTRENGRTRTLGFLYKDHILTCTPANGSMLPFKKHLFLRCRLTGQVTRMNEFGFPVERKPKLQFTNLDILSEKEQLDFGNFGDDE